MDSNVKTHLLEAIRFMMKPLVRLMINQGVTHAEFSETLKEVYVESAIRHFGDPNKVNRSKIAILTGMTRKEAKNVIDRALAQGEEKNRKSRPERVLTGWFNDPAFQGPYGLPLDLSYESLEKNQPSFVELVKRYSGDMSPKVMLEELIRGGSVVEIDNMLKAVRRDFEPTALSSRLIGRLGEVGHYVFLTAAANIEKESQGSGHFDRYAYADDGCTENVIAKLDDYMKIRGQEFLEDLDRWLSRHETENVEDAPRKETGVYICQYVADPKEREGLTELLIQRGVEAAD